MGDPETVIRVENLGKKYLLAHQEKGPRYQALRDVLVNAGRNLAQRLRHPFSPANSGASREEFWALTDVSFEVKRGEVVGIIGRNGAGKSTLLKILSRITEPTTGRVTLHGRVASLLEVGTGFHPELTGRENIYLNGAILGMSRAEIRRKFDEIVAFAEVEKFLDTPVKHYSSGMYMRLAFAVAAHLDSEILLIDEVLAVGDLSFQDKCLRKMDSVSHSGRTVMFVSHNLNTVVSLCKRCLVLLHGSLAYSGSAVETAHYYTSGKVGLDESSQWSGDAGDENARLLRTWIRPLDTEHGFDVGSALEIGLEVELFKNVLGLILGFSLVSEHGYELAYVLYDDGLDSPPPTVLAGRMIRRFMIPANTLTHGRYRIVFDVGIHPGSKFIQDEGSLEFGLTNVAGIARRFPPPQRRGFCSLFRPLWSVEEPA